MALRHVELITPLIIAHEARFMEKGPKLVPLRTFTNFVHLFLLLSQLKNEWFISSTLPLHLAQTPSLIVKVRALFPMKNPSWTILQTIILVLLKELLPQTRFHKRIQTTSSSFAPHLLSHLINLSRGWWIIDIQWALVRSQPVLCPKPISQYHALFFWSSVGPGRPRWETFYISWFSTWFSLYCMFLIWGRIDYVVLHLLWVILRSRSSWICLDANRKSSARISSYDQSWQPLQSLINFTIVNWAGRIASCSSKKRFLWVLFHPTKIPFSVFDLLILRSGSSRIISYGVQEFLDLLEGALKPQITTWWASWTHCKSSWVSRADIHHIFKAMAYERNAMIPKPPSALGYITSSHATNAFLGVPSLVYP